MILQTTPRLDKSGWLLKLEDRKEKIFIDIMVNKISEVYNSNLISQYALIDNRFHKLAHIRKKWNNNVSENVNERLNNFTIYLMLIAFMQSEKMLPNL